MKKIGTFDAYRRTNGEAKIIKNVPYYEYFKLFEEVFVIHPLPDPDLRTLEYFSVSHKDTGFSILNDNETPTSINLAKIYAMQKIKEKGEVLTLKCIEQAKETLLELQE